MAEEQTSIRVAKETRDRLAAFATWGESLDQAINRAFDLLQYRDLAGISRRWAYMSFSYRYQFDGGEIVYFPNLHNRLGSARIVLSTSPNEIKLWLAGDEWGTFDTVDGDELPLPTQRDLTDAPIMARFGDVEKSIGTLTIRAASLDGRKAGYPVDPSLNDLIWMDFLLGNYERIIDEVFPLEGDADRS